MRDHEAQGSGWSFEPAAGLRGVVRDEEHRPRAVVHYGLRANGGMRLGVVKVEWFALDGTGRYLDDEEPFPLRWAVDQANEPATFLVLLDLRNAEPDAGEVQPMRLPEAFVKATGRKPDRFYERVAYYVRFCAEHGIAHGPRLAKDNAVAETTVYRWVNEARRRGLLGEAAP